MEKIQRQVGPYFIRGRDTDTDRGGAPYSVSKREWEAGGGDNWHLRPQKATRGDHCHAGPPAAAAAAAAGAAKAAPGGTRGGPLKMIRGKRGPKRPKGAPSR